MQLSDNCECTNWCPSRGRRIQRIAAVTRTRRAANIVAIKQSVFGISEFSLIYDSEHLSGGNRRGASAEELRRSQVERTKRISS